MRDRLIDLIVSADISLFGTNKPYAEVYADYLLANGVIVPPCKVGDFVELDNGLKDSKPKLSEVKGFLYNPADLGLRYILEDCRPIISFSGIEGIVPKEEAEAKLKGGEQK